LCREINCGVEDLLGPGARATGAIPKDFPKRGNEDEMLAMGTNRVEVAKKLRQLRRQLEAIEIACALSREHAGMDFGCGGVRISTPSLGRVSP